MAVRVGYFMAKRCKTEPDGLIRFNTHLENKNRKLINVVKYEYRMRNITIIYVYSE